MKFGKILIQISSMAILGMLIIFSGLSIAGILGHKFLLMIGGKLGWFTQDYVAPAAAYSAALIQIIVIGALYFMLGRIFSQHREPLRLWETLTLANPISCLVAFSLYFFFPIRPLPEFLNQRNIATLLFAWVIFAGLEIAGNRKPRRRPISS